jgi:26S proteasome regulatory subunit T1
MKIIPVDPLAAKAAKAVNSLGALQGQKGEDKFIINIKQIAKFVVAWADRHWREYACWVSVMKKSLLVLFMIFEQHRPEQVPNSDPTATTDWCLCDNDASGRKARPYISDVGGCKEQIEKLREVIETPLLSVSSVPRYCSPQTKTLITQNDLSMSEFDPLKDVLPYGTPGTGKTLCAWAVADCMDATFIFVIGSELVQKYVGEGAWMVCKLFKMAHSKKACIIFFNGLGKIWWWGWWW